MRSRWAWAARPLAIAIVSRAFSIAVILGLAALRRSNEPHVFAAWDGNWYLRIARDGYHTGLIGGGYDYAFYPGWPLVLRLGSFGSPNGTTATVIANLLFIVAALVFWRLIAGTVDEHVATAATALLAFAPPAYIFSMTYSESLFLLLATGSLLVTSPRWRTFLAAMAALSRVTGLALVVTAAAAQVCRAPSRRAMVFTGIGALAGFAAWWLFVAVLTGNPAGYLTGSTAWVHDGTLTSLARELGHHRLRLAAWAAFCLVLVVGAGLMWRRDRDLGTYAFAALGIALIPLVFGGIVHSVPRYALLAFPAFAGLALPLGRRGTIALVTLFMVGQVVFASWTIGPGGQAP